MILFQILAIVAAFGCIVCLILTLIQMFKHDQTLPAVLGILCGLWAFIWGWMNASKHKHKKVMLIWTACLIAAIVCNVLSVVVNPGAF